MSVFAGAATMVSDHEPLASGDRRQFDGETRRQVRMSAANDSVSRAIEPVVAAAGLALYDIELSGAGRTRVLRVTVTDSSGKGPDIDRIASLTRDLDPIVDEVVSGSFSLEVSSPGLERVLRTTEHFAGAHSERVSVKYRSDGVAMRTTGSLVASDATTVEVLDDSGEVVVIAFDDVTAARTVFDWGPAPRPGKGSKPGSTKARGSAPPDHRTKEPSS